MFGKFWGKCEKWHLLGVKLLLVLLGYLVEKIWLLFIATFGHTDHILIFCIDFMEHTKELLTLSISTLFEVVRWPSQQQSLLHHVTDSLHKKGLD